jgi:hypothetical protein
VRSSCSMRFSLGLVALVFKGLIFLLLLDYENYYPKGKKEVPKGDGSKKSESKRKFPSRFSCSC